MGQALTPSEYRLLLEHSPVMVWRSGLPSPSSCCIVRPVKCKQVS
jgi:hypothetical protein